MKELLIEDEIVESFIEYLSEYEIDTKEDIECCIQEQADISVINTCNDVLTRVRRVLSFLTSAHESGENISLTIT